MSVGPEAPEAARPPVLTLKAQISAETAIFVETTSLAELARVMSIFNLVPQHEGLAYRGRALVDGEWQEWHPITREVYENRRKWPREGYEVEVFVAEEAAS